jgi:hypothetical protein
MRIIRAHTKEYLGKLRTLFREYEAFLGVAMLINGFKHQSTRRRDHE